MEFDKYSIALVSMESRCGRAEQNLERICAYIAQAGGVGARLAVFPELALTGYCLRHAKETALSASHPYVDVLRIAARDSGLTALIGMAERADDCYWITQLICGSDGTLQIYRKTHLGAREKEVFSMGERLPVFGGELPFGVLICYDMHFPEAAATQRAAGAELIMSPHASPVKAGSRETVWERYMPARAYDNRIYVACCNACGENGCGTDFSGGMAVYAPDGSAVAADFSGREIMRTVTLKQMPFCGGKNFPMHRRPELYKDEPNMDTWVSTISRARNSISERAGSRPQDSKCISEEHV
jgi:predicted amidohydrolase